MNILTINTTSQNDLQPYDEVIVNGVSFLPNEKIPNTVRVYWFDSNGFRIRVRGKTLDDILLETKRLVASYRGVSLGMVTLLHANPDGTVCELRRRAFEVDTNRTTPVPTCRLGYESLVEILSNPVIFPLLSTNHTK